MKKKQWIVIGTVFLMVFGICLFLGMRKAWNHSSNEREKDENAVQNGDGSQESRGVARTGQVFDPEASDLKAVDGFAVSPEKDMTIMIYMIGSNLESNLGKATSDLEEISASGFDTRNLNVIVYTGGSRRWTGDVPSNKNCVLDMGRAQEERIVAQTEKNADMGAPGTLSDFVNFCDAYYPAKRHGLILWDHGGGPLLGYGADELFEYDSLLLSEMQAAMRKTQYGSSKKLDFVGFDACIMACIENMNIWTEYADYFIGSEELEPGDGWDYGFLKLVKPETKMREICTGVIDYFEKYYKGVISDNYHPDLTLCCVDLHQLETLKDSIDHFSKKCLDAYTDGGYTQIAISRSQVKGLAKAAESDKDGGRDSYDIVDVGDMAKKFKWVGEREAKDLIDGISAVMIKSYTNVEDLHGISMYFPFGNKSQYRAKQKEYQDFAASTNYRSFLQETSGEWLAERQAGWRLADPKEDESGQYVELTQEQAENIVSASYTIMMMHDEYGYLMLMENVSIKPDGEGRLYLPEDLSIVCLGGEDMVCSVREMESSNARRLYVTEGFRVSENPMLYGTLLATSLRRDVQATIIQKGEELILQSVNTKDEDIISAGKSTVDLGNWGGIEVLPHGKLPIRDIDGQLLPMSEWLSSQSGGWLAGVCDEKMEFVRIPIENLSGEYLAQIQVEDIYGDVYASELIPLHGGSNLKTERIGTPNGILEFGIYDDHAVLKKYYGDESEVEIPELVDGKPVTEIGKAAFSSDVAMYDHYYLNLKKVTLPSSLKAIGVKAFSGCWYLEEIDLPEGLETIGAGAFQLCRKFESIELPASLSKVGDGFLAECSGLKEISLEEGNLAFSIKDGALYSKDGKVLYAYPAALTGRFEVAEGTEEIAQAAFFDSGITEVTLPDSLIKIQNLAFYDSKLTEPPAFPGKLSWIGSGAFGKDMNGVEREDINREPAVIRIGAGVKNIGADAFELFPVRRFEVAPDNPYFSEVDGNLMSKAGDVLICFALLGEDGATVPDGTVEIDNYGMGYIQKRSLEFDACHIRIPDSVTRFPSRLSLYVSKLVIHCNAGSKAEEVAESLDIPVSYDPVVDLPLEGIGETTIQSGKIRYELYRDHAVITYCELPERKEGETIDIELPSEIEGRPVTVIGNGKRCIFTESDYQSLSYTQCIDRLVIPEGVTRIADKAIDVTIELKLPSSLKEIGNNAIQLRGVKETVPLEMPKNVESLGSYFVMGPMEEFTVTSALQHIAPGAFSYCRGLKRFVMQGKNVHFSVREGMLYSADGTVLLAAVEGVTAVPEGTVKIADRAFYNQSRIEEISLPNSLEEIGEYCFNGCNRLERILFSENGRLKKIGGHAFESCYALKEVRLPDSVTEIGTYLFSGCSSLQSARLPREITEVPSDCFNHCGQLTEVEFSDQITSIGEYAFQNCSSLHDFQIPKNVTEIGENAFRRDTEIAFSIDPGNKCFEITDAFLIDVRRMRIVACQGDLSGEVRVPEDIMDVGYAFDEQKWITDLYLPPSVIRILGLPWRTIDGEFRCVLTLHGEKGSYTERYANKEDIAFQETN